MAASMKKPESTDPESAGGRFSRRVSHQLFPLPMARLFARSTPRLTATPAAPLPNVDEAGQPEAQPEIPPPAPNDPGQMSVSVIIAMPVASNPTFIPQGSESAGRQSLDSTGDPAKGKSRATGTKTPSIVQEEELPDIVIGVTDVGCAAPTSTPEHVAKSST